MTQPSALLHFLQQLDIDMVELVLHDHRTYQDFPKHIFIQKLSTALDDFIRAGDTYLERYEGCCNEESCNFKCKGFTFIGNNSGDYFDLIIEEKEGEITDIYECRNFKTANKKLIKNRWVLIDRTGLPF